MKGSFITIEGTDGSGKSTQLGLLVEYLKGNGYEVIVTREPGGTAVGEKIREMILSVENKSMTGMAEALLYAAARAQHMEELIKPAIESGKLVICDRFVDSSVAYQGCGRGLGKVNIEEINSFAVMGMMPDLTLFFDLSPQKGILRKEKEHELDRLELEKMDFHKRVYDGYKVLCLENQKRIKVINADRAIEDIHRDVIAEVEAILK